MRRYTLIALIAAAALLGACVERGYDAKPVVDKDDPREVDVPFLGDTETREKQDCFMIKIWADGWGFDEQDEGIACMVETDEGGIK